ncbi:hypothetical protein [Pseudomonas benzenivorans]|uniref:Oxidoreductase molybdopterin-binding domain-containing protein n=1 Tax=Pseudomonas benzenivorans TaxID=556533 RepID=A0ABY5H7Y1_9PSED|nr:hypothetical protein [Pseudomonas benzenivorans]UTW08365.1 hypothetical protein KDW96_03290 [Pseudomonas benzenivorans]
MLRVSGPDGSSIDYDLAALEAMESATLHTHTSWTDGPQQFTGVRASQLLAPYDGQGASVRAVALNDYESRMDLQKLQRYPAIVAYKRNGQYMTTRDKGPLWMIFPQDDFPELRTAETDQEMVWHLKGLIVE